MRAAFPENQRQVEESPCDEARVQRREQRREQRERRGVIAAAVCRRERGGKRCGVY